VSPELEYQILDMRTRGFDPHEIAVMLNVSRQAAQIVIREASKAARDNHRAVVDETFLMSQRRCEFLIKKCQEILDAALKVNDFKNALDAMKVFIVAMTRQANLLGLDHQKTKSLGDNGRGSGAYDWLADPNIAPEKVVAEAKRQGLSIPETFVQSFTEHPKIVV
jgi:formylmethanofuran dehydrogenase subunit A